MKSNSPSGHLLAGDFYFFRLREFDLAKQQYEAGMAAASEGQSGVSEAPGRVVRQHRKESGRRISWRTLC